MSKAFGPGWKSAALSIDDLLLDPQNPRLDLKPTANQEQIRKALLASEEVFDLIHKIVKSQGLIAGERLIVAKEAGRHVVLEGNRRTTAIQVLRNPSLLPKDQQKRIPEVTPELKARLAKVPVDIAPNRLSAEPILTRRHTERGAKPWSTVANMRRVQRYAAEGRSIDEIHSILALSKARTTQLLRGYNLLTFAQSSPDWTAEEKVQLADPKLVTTGFTRFFTLKDARVKLDLNFDEKQQPASGHPGDQLQKEIQRIARGFLIKIPNSAKTAFDTRSTPEEVLEGKRRPSVVGISSKVSSIKTPSASSFFEKLDCKANDDSLLKLCGELREVEYEKRPIAATMLLRSTFETALVYQLKKKNQWSALVTSNAGKDPSLKEIINYSSQVKNNVFNEQRITTILSSRTVLEAKDYLDLVVHQRWADADSTKLHSIANSLRKLITAIVEDTQ